MRSSNAAVIRGRIAHHFELENTQKGTATCQFNVAVSRPWRKDVEEKADFVRVKAYGKTAEFVHKYFSKGDLIALAGELRVDQWTDRDGKIHSMTYLLVESVEFAEAKRNAEKSEPEPSSALSPAAVQELQLISDDDELPF